MTLNHWHTCLSTSSAVRCHGGRFALIQWLGRGMPFTKPRSMHLEHSLPPIPFAWTTAMVKRNLIAQMSTKRLHTRRLQPSTLYLYRTGIHHASLGLLLSTLQVPLTHIVAYARHPLLILLVLIRIPPRHALRAALRRRLHRALLRPRSHESFTPSLPMLARCDLVTCLTTQGFVTCSVLLAHEQESLMQCTPVKDGVTWIGSVGAHGACLLMGIVQRVRTMASKQEAALHGCAKLAMRRLSLRESRSNS